MKTVKFRKGASYLQQQKFPINKPPNINLTNKNVFIVPSHEKRHFAKNRLYSKMKFIAIDSDKKLKTTNNSVHATFRSQERQPTQDN